MSACQLSKTQRLHIVLPLITSPHLSSPLLSIDAIHATTFFLHVEYECPSEPFKSRREGSCPKSEMAAPAELPRLLQRLQSLQRRASPTPLPLIRHSNGTITTTLQTPSTLASCSPFQKVVAGNLQIPLPISQEALLLAHHSPAIALAQSRRVLRNNVYLRRSYLDRSQRPPNL